MGRPAKHQQLEPVDLLPIIELIKVGFSVKEIAEKFDATPSVVYTFLSNYAVDIKQLALSSSMTMEDLRSNRRLRVKKPVVITKYGKPSFIITPYNDEYKEKLL